MSFGIPVRNGLGIGLRASTSLSTRSGGGGAPEVILNGASISSGAYVYNNSNTVNTLTVTGGPVAVTVRAWGAAGGNGSYGTESSGAGGYARGTITLQPGTTYYLYVGQGGFGPAATNGAGGLGGWPNGGYGSMGDASGAGGGGMTMLSKAVFSTGMSNSDILLIAGAGGGSTGYLASAGAGGGTAGQNSNIATGGTQLAGGTTNGAKLAGGNSPGPRTTTSENDDGGGGGGYYGGGSGIGDGVPGAGGSGYFNPSLVSSSTLTTGTNATAPNPESLLPAGYAMGKAGISGTPQNGNPGVVYLTF